MSGVYPKPVKSETLGAELRHGLWVFVPQLLLLCIQGWESPSQKAFLCLPDLVFLEHWSWNTSLCHSFVFSIHFLVLSLVILFPPPRVGGENLHTLPIFPFSPYHTTPISSWHLNTPPVVSRGRSWLAAVHLGTANLLGDRRTATTCVTLCARSCHVRSPIRC